MWLEKLQNNRDRTNSKSVHLGVFVLSRLRWKPRPEQHSRPHAGGPAWVFPQKLREQNLELVSESGCRRRRFSLHSQTRFSCKYETGAEGGPLRNDK